MASKVKSVPIQARPPPPRFRTSSARHASPRPAAPGPDLLLGEFMLSKVLPFANHNEPNIQEMALDCIMNAAGDSTSTSTQTTRSNDVCSSSFAPNAQGDSDFAEETTVYQYGPSPDRKEVLRRIRRPIPRRFARRFRATSRPQRATPRTNARYKRARRS